MRRTSALLALLGGLVGAPGCAATPGARAPQIVVPGVDGEGHALFGGHEAGPVLLLFAATDCPISNYFAPEVGRIHAEYAPRGVDVYLVYADADVDAGSIRRHLEDFSYPMPALLDFEHALVDLTGATMTPEAALLSGDGELLYRGRIDDTYVAYGKRRRHPAQRDLRAALDAVLDGRAPVPARTEVVGCFIPEPAPASADR